MKIRTGFVSNSSSSSFTLIANKDEIDKALDFLKRKKKEAYDYIKDLKIFKSDKHNYILIEDIRENNNLTFWNNGHHQVESLMELLPPNTYEYFIREM